MLSDEDPAPDQPDSGLAVSDENSSQTKAAESQSLTMKLSPELEGSTALELCDGNELHVRNRESPIVDQSRLTL